MSPNLLKYLPIWLKASSAPALVVVAGLLEVVAVVAWVVVALLL